MKERFLNPKFAKWVLWCVLGLTLFFAYRGSLLTFNYNFTDYFPKNDKDVDAYFEFRKKYGSENDILILILEDEKVFSPQFMKKLDGFGEEIKSIKGIKQVVCPTKIRQPIISAFGFSEIPLIHINNASLLKLDSVKIFQSKEWLGTFFGKNGKSVLLMIEHEDGLIGPNAQDLLAKLEGLCVKYKWSTRYLSGRIYAEQVFVENMKSELILFISLSIMLLVVFLSVAYRSVWGVMVPLLAVLISIVWTCGIMQLTGYQIDVLTVLLPSILFIITISDITHFLSKYMEDLRMGHSSEFAFKMAFKEVGVATFVTALTTAVGFVTFLNAQMQPIRFFGLYAAIGVFVSYGIAFTFMPAMILVFAPSNITRLKPRPPFWNSKLHKLLLWVFKNYRSIQWGALLICVLSLFGMFQIEVNSTILDDISNKHPIKKSLKYSEQNFGGVRPFEMEIILPEGSNIFDTSTFAIVHGVEKFLEERYQVNQIIGPTAFIKGLNKAQNGAHNEYFEIPKSKEELSRLLRLLKRESGNKVFRRYLRKGGRELRISGRVHDLGNQHFAQKDKILRAFVDSIRVAGLNIDYKVTGSATLVDKNNTQLANDMILDLFVGILTIGIIVGFIFKSIRMAILAIIPNFAPLFLIAGVMGVFGLNLKASNSIIFSIAFGIAIDDSIHFLSRVKEELNKGKPILYAIKTTYLSTGRAMLITSLIVISGFCTMIFSDFGGTFYMGLLVSLTLVFALAFDFLLMPALLISFYKPRHDHPRD